MLVLLLCISLFFYFFLQLPYTADVGRLSLNADRRSRVEEKVAAEKVGKKNCFLLSRVFFIFLRWLDCVLLFFRKFLPGKV